MPSYEDGAIGPEDLGAWVSWIKSRPPVNTDHADQRLGPLGTVLFLVGQLPLLPAEMIDHDALSAADFSQPEVGVRAVYDEYIALSCTGCHSVSYAGALPRLQSVVGTIALEGQIVVGVARGRLRWGTAAARGTPAVATTTGG
jgi:hypothetical protein